jgi:peptidylprolyl isomerase
VRAATSLVLAVGLVASLAACSTTAPTADGCEAIPSGAVSSAVKVSGDIDSAPTVEVSGLSVPTATERSVVIAGDGAVAQPGDDVVIEYTILSLLTGESVDSTAYDGTNSATFSLDGTLVAGFEKTMLCSTEGSRVVGVLATEDGLAASQLTQLGLTEDDSLVLVLDILSVDTPEPIVPPLSRAEGEAQDAPAGFPAVTLDADGRPTVTIPDAAPPTELELAVLIQGDGAEVPEGADVVVHYVGVNWNTQVIFDESWARGEPATFNTGQVIAGFTAALVGQKVGSQVIVVIPPDQGYGEAGNPPNIGGTDTLVFVVDILGIA